MSHTDAQSLIDRVVHGAHPKDVVGSVLQAKKKRSVPLPAQRNGPAKGSGEYVLGHLRPNDRFRFSGDSPLPHLGDGYEFTVVPAARGFVAFLGENQETCTLRLRDSLEYPVSLLSDPSTISDRRFHEGDRVRHKMSGAFGVVLGMASGNSYQVRLDNGNLEEFPNQALSLVNKDETTRGYIQCDESDQWVVSFGDYRSEHASQLDAVKNLYSVHRSAFNRWSKLAATDPNIQLDVRAVKYLVRVDPRVWRSKMPLMKRGLATKDQSLEEALRELRGKVFGDDQSGS